MEKKLTNSGPLREPADKHSIYPSPIFIRNVPTRGKAMWSSCPRPIMSRRMEAPSGAANGSVGC